MEKFLIISRLMRRILQNTGYIYKILRPSRSVIFADATARAPVFHATAYQLLGDVVQSGDCSNYRIRQ